MKKLEGKVAIITGANRGIGNAIATALANEGANVVLAARSAESLQAATETIIATGAKAIAVPTDVTAEEDVENLFQQTIDHFGRLDILVNNAGAFDGGSLEDISVETWDKVMAVNLRGPFLCTRSAMRIMKKEGGGRIINIGSISAQKVRLNSAPYSASKHGVWGLTQSTALEGRDFGITCCCLHPGNVMVERRQTDQVQDDEPMMSPAEIAEVALLMATLPPHVAMLESIVLPIGQLYVGRG